MTRRRLHAGRDAPAAWSSPATSSSADFARLLELARLTDALLVDGDGVYDLAGRALGPWRS
ncbi:hypothetical protein [Streptomyces sp. NPDC096030]|uniref:hypothetical protein n=1 Tax=Streptomyces sp. NPDC096030 TaxID=3155423 RepID=UPI00331E160A